jgi:hypothetical protein
MESSEISIVKFAFMNFWAVVIQTRPMQPTSTLMVKLVEALITSEPEPDPIHKKRVEWIYNHTSEEIDIPLSIVELAVFRNLNKGLNCEIDLGEKTFYLIELYRILDNISKELCNIVISIGKFYAFDVPNLNIGKIQTQSIGFDEVN